MSDKEDNEDGLQMKVPTSITKSLTSLLKALTRGKILEMEVSGQQSLEEVPMLLICR